MAVFAEISLTEHPQKKYVNYQNKKNHNRSIPNNINLVLKKNFTGVQIRSDCAPQLLQEFLISETADEADEAATNVKGQKDEEEQLLLEVRNSVYISADVSITSP